MVNWKENVGVVLWQVNGDADELHGVVTMTQELGLADQEAWLQPGSELHHCYLNLVSLV
jgi:hypothetical protein